METETKTKTPRLYDHRSGATGLVVIAGGTTGSRERVHVTRDGLQAIVQAAYDQHGIIATPDWHTEALAAEQAGLAAFEAEQASPYCQCMHPGCSDALQAAHNSGVRA